MASDAHTSSPARSSFQKTVCLQSWWLVKAEENSHGRRLAVAGFLSREQQAMRLFSSAPIVKRFDVFTLETVDGICVMIKGFIDKARTEENGFPSEVFKHFVFGFPPYWEEYAEKCFGEECSSDLPARSNPGPEKASPCMESIQKPPAKTFPCSETLAGAEESSERGPTHSKKATSGKAHGEGQKKNLEEKSNSKMDKMEKRWLRREKKSSDVILPQESEVRFGHPDSSSPGLRNAKVPWSPDGGSLISTGHVNNTSEKHLATSRLEGHTITGSSADTVNFTCGSAHIKSVKSSTDCDIRSPLSACHMSKTREPNSISKAHQKQKNGRSFLAKQLGINFIQENNSPDLSHGSGTVLRSSRELKGVKKDDQVSTSGIEKEKDVSVSSAGSFNNEVQGSEDSVTIGTSGDQCLRNEMTRGNPFSRLSTRSLEQFPYTGKNIKQDQNHAEIPTESSIQKGMDKTVSPSRNSTSVKKKEKVAIGSKKSISRIACASGRETKRKFPYENLVPEDAGEQVRTASPERVPFKRSRSGRLLLPTLEFWRNQIPIYDADRKITGIKEGPHLEHPYKGSRSEPPRKRRPFK